MRIGVVLVLFLVTAPAWLAVLAFAGEPGKPTPIAASHVTIQSPSIKLLDALKEVQRQTGNVVEDVRPRRGQLVTNPVLDLDLQQVPFWEALDAIARKADVSLYPHTGGSSVGILKGPAGGVRAAYSGPFRVALKRLTAVLDLQDGNRYLEGTLELAWEPRYRPLLLKSGGETVRAFTTDQELPTPPSAGRGDVRLVGLQAIDWPVRLSSPSRAVVTLKRLEGTIGVLVAPGTLSFRLDAQAVAQAGQGKPQEQNQEGVAVALRQLRVERGRATAVIELRYPADALDLESHQIWAVQDALRVEKDGKPLGDLKNLGRDVNVKEGNVIEVTYRLGGVRADLKGVTLHYDAPAVPVLYRVKFLFDDVPLP